MGIASFLKRRSITSLPRDVLLCSEQDSGHHVQDLLYCILLGVSAVLSSIAHEHILHWVTDVGWASLI
jgi:hypothetical protein